MNEIVAGGSARSGQRNPTVGPVPARLAAVSTLLAGILAFAPAHGAEADAATAATASLNSDVPTVTADALPTVQIDGVVWDQVIVGDRVYVTGEFDNARPAGAPPGTNLTARANILAYDLDTGELIQSWAPTLNRQGVALAASADGSRIYVGGDFDRVNGQWRSRIAALDAQTGALIDGWNPSANNRVSALAVDADTVYLGGHFTIVGNQPRTRLAAVDADSGDLLPWAPRADRDVAAIAVHAASSRVIVGGSFLELNGDDRPGSGALDSTTGETLPWALRDTIRNGGPSSYISGLTVDGDRVYGVGWVYYAGGGSGTFEGVLGADVTTGELLWVNGCLGDRYGVVVGGDAVYSVGHEHDCGMVGYHRETSPRDFQYAGAMNKNGPVEGAYNAHGPFDRWHYLAGEPATDGLHWLPTFSPGTHTGSRQAGWTVDASDSYVVIGGEFPNVNGRAQQGLVRFTIAEQAPNAERPQRFDEVTPRLMELSPGTVRVEWTAAWDRDDRTLTYELLRGPQTHNAELLGTWTVESDPWRRPPMAFIDTTAPPGPNRYRVRVTDGDGNGGPSTSTVIDVSEDEPIASAYQQRVASLGAMNHWRLGETDGTVAFDTIGANDLDLWSQSARGEPGALLDDDDAATAWPGTFNSNTVPAASEWRQRGPQTFTVEAWFHTTSTQGGKIVGFGDRRNRRSSFNATDRHIYLTDDGRLVFGLRPDYGERRTIQSVPGLNDGAWHHVVATLSGDGARLYVDGELAAEDPILTKAQEYWGYWRIAGDRLSQWPSAPSREAFEGAIDEVAIYPTALDAGQVQGNYAASGRDGGFENFPPVATFDASTAWLTATFDASASHDPDGEIVAYEWDFGDGDVLTTTDPVVSHGYAAPGTCNVTLTVVDQLDASDETDDDVTVAEPPLAADGFDRSETDGWGTADAGGSWTPTGSASNFSVMDGFGHVSLTSPGMSRTAYLDDLSAADVDLHTDVAVDRPAGGGGTYVSLLARRVAANAQYRALVRFLPNGQVMAALLRDAPGANGNLGWTYVPDLAYTPGQRLQVRFLVSGTELKLKVWEPGSTEPAEWLVEAVDDTPDLQGPGTVGMTAYMSSSSGAVPAVASFDEFVAVSSG